MVKKIMNNFGTNIILIFNLLKLEILKNNKYLNLNSNILSYKKLH